MMPLGNVTWLACNLQTWSRFTVVIWKKNDIPDQLLLPRGYNWENFKAYFWSEDQRSHFRMPNNWSAKLMNFQYLIGLATLYISAESKYENISIKRNFRQKKCDPYFLTFRWIWKCRSRINWPYKSL